MRVDTAFLKDKRMCMRTKKEQMNYGNLDVNKKCLYCERTDSKTRKCSNNWVKASHNQKEVYQKNQRKIHILQISPQK